MTNHFRFSKTQQFIYSVHSFSPKGHREAGKNRRLYTSCWMEIETSVS